MENKKSIRDGFGEGIVEARNKNNKIVALSADLSGSLRLDSFKEKYPESYIECGVAEQNMATIGAGLALHGKIPFITSFASFNPGRNYDQIRTTIALNDVPVKIVGSHAGISVGPDGATHQMLEDISMMRTLPNMTVICPCDAEEARKATLAIAETKDPTYMRFGRHKSPVLTDKDSSFEIGKANIMFESENPKVVIFATGYLVAEVLKIAKEVNAIVVNIHTIKPIDEEKILEVSKKVDLIVTVEDHQIVGGLGSAVCEVLSEYDPKKVIRLGMQDEFGQSGNEQELIKHYGLDSESIKTTIKNNLK